MNNTEVASNGTEFYADELFKLADLYMETHPEWEEEEFREHFRDALFYIHDRMRIPEHSDIKGLDALFEAYVRLCTRFRKLPTMEGFAFLTGINRATFCDWRNREYRASTEHSNTVEKWKDICRAFVVDELTNNEKVNPNLIFVVKAAHGLRETAPLVAGEAQSKPMLSTEELIMLDDKSPGNCEKNQA